MSTRSQWLSAVLLPGLALVGCGGGGDVDSVVVTPATQSIAGGSTVQFTATGIRTHVGHATTTVDLTKTATWASSAPSIATIDSSGLSMGLTSGTTTITATTKGFGGTLIGSATLTVTSGGGGATEPLVSLLIIPAASTASVINQTTQFTAIATTVSGNTLDLTSSPVTINGATIQPAVWKSSTASVVTINAATGLATAVGDGLSTITAVAKNPDGTVVTGIATFTVVTGTSQQFTALTVTPSSESLSASGQTSQFVALANIGTSGFQQDVTSSPQIRWISSIPTIASISSSGLATGLGVGSTTITAELTTPNGTLLSASAAITVSLTSAPEPLLALTIIPSSITVGDLQDTGQFLAIGTFSSVPYVRDLTNQPGTTWISSSPDSFPVNINSGGTSSASAGIVTAYGSTSGTAGVTIIAEVTSVDGTIQTATASFACPLILPTPTIPGSCYQGQVGPLKATLTIYGEGLNTTNWLLTAPSATGTPDVIHCGPGWAADGNAGGSVCVGIYPIGTTVILTAPAQQGVAFGGWTYNCTPIVPINATGPNSCTIVLGQTNATVGAIFN